MDEFVQKIGEDTEQLLSNWAFYIVLFVGIICFLTVWDQKRTTGIMNTLVDIARQLVSYVLAAMTELVGAVRNLLGFTGALRYIFFGRMNNGVKFIISNYAVMFAMIVSVAMVGEGLSGIMGGISAAAIAIAIQGGFLLSVLWLVQLFIPEEERDKRIVQYYLLTDRNDFLAKENRQETDALRKNMSKAISSKGRNHIWKKRVFAILMTLLLLVMITLFSYIYLFQIRLEGITIFHGLYTIEKIADEKEVSCSENLKQYYQQTEQFLREYIRRIEEFYMQSDQKPDQDLRDALADLKTFMQNPEKQLQQADQENGKNGFDWTGLENGFDELTEWAYQKETEQFKGSNELKQEVFAFSDDFTTEMKWRPQTLQNIRYVKENVHNLFDNYKNLTQYFHEKTDGRTDFEYEPKITKNLILRNNEGSRYLGEETALKEFRLKLLQDLSDILYDYEEVPKCHDILFYKIASDNTGDAYVRFPEFDASIYTKELKNIYRILNPNVLSIERAILSLRYTFQWDGWFSAWMIGFIFLLQSLIVFICFIRGGLTNIASISEKKNLVRCLFIQESHNTPRDIDVLRTAVILGGISICFVIGIRAELYRKPHVFIALLLAGAFISDMVFSFVKTVFGIRIAERIDPDNQGAGQNTAEPPADSSNTDPDVNAAESSSVFDSYLTDYARELLDSCTMALLGKVESKYISLIDMDDVDQFRDSQMKIWKHDYHYKLKAYIPRYRWRQIEIGRMTEECMYVSKADVQGINSSVIALLRGKDLVYAVYKEEASNEIIGYVFSNEWKVLLIECLIIRYMNGYSIPRTFEEDLKDYEEDIEE